MDTICDKRINFSKNIKQTTYIILYIHVMVHEDTIVCNKSRCARMMSD